MICTYKIYSHLLAEVRTIAPSFTTYYTSKTVQFFKSKTKQIITKVSDLLQSIQLHTVIEEFTVDAVLLHNLTLHRSHILFVSQHMSIQVRLLSGPIRTQRTRVRLLPGVSTDVRSKNALVGGTVRTILTSKGSFSCMRIDVFPQEPLSRGTVSTVWT